MESTNIDLFYNVWVVKVILEALGEFVTPIWFSFCSNHTYFFQRIRLKGPISKYCHIFLETARINELIPLFSSVTRLDHLTTIGEVLQEFNKCN